ncbi:putative ribosomal protein l32 [Erysiphe neolycopersici]|uniref:Putative ribosomal protein l32 n=1 Tax=Erysiphe neolycopersici TaxID=212602 RepID=A0A420HTH1_9PEZI|nr:putative ribosomal protein l32 [Erysiphe neolycopersici]
MSTATLTSFSLDHLSCPNCGAGLEGVSLAVSKVQQQIEDLTSQTRILTERAINAVDKWADYEDQIRALRTQIKLQSQTSQSNEPKPQDERPSSIFSGYNFPLFFSSRKSTPQPPPTETSSIASSSKTDLAEELTRERSLRVAAEGKLSESSGEIEELSSQLFTQANEMVAAERRMRAKLESRVEILEKRDIEKKQRLERLESAVQRIERVRGLLASRSKITIS